MGRKNCLFVSLVPLSPCLQGVSLSPRSPHLPISHVFIDLNEKIKCLTVYHFLVNGKIHALLSMAINWIKRVFVLATILAVVLLLPFIASAAPESVDFSKSAIVSQAPNSSSETNLTPQHRQQLQAVRQRRNRDIKAMLDSSQRAKLAKTLHAGNSFNQALESLDLQPDQQEMLKAIVQISNLKMKAISARFLHN
jgi:hypothetical protein